MLITAHSGCDGTPDNSFEFVRHAITLSVDALEIDIRKASDDTLVLSHDELLPDGSNVYCTLEEVFALIAPTGLKVNCDLKLAGLEKAVMDLAKKYDLLQRLIFSGTVSAELRDNLPQVYEAVEVFINCDMLVPEIMTYMEAEQPPGDALLCKALFLCREKGFRVMNLYYKLCTPEVVRLARELDVKLSVWTVNEETEIRSLLPCDLYNMTSRCPGLVRKLAEEIENPAMQTKR